MFAEHMDGLKIAPIALICCKRHDIVHRNGKTVRDEPIDLTVEEVRDAMLVVLAFADDLQRRINDALDDGSEQI